jgi:type IV pilus assembly protein PilV
MKTTATIIKFNMPGYAFARRLNRRTVRTERGMMLLESLVSIMVFSIGVLGVVSMQAVSVHNVTEAQYRTDASFLANELVGRMWTNRANITSFDYPGTGAVPITIADWVTKVAGTMPGAAGSPPLISVTNTDHIVTGTTDYLTYAVQISVRWQSPQEANFTPPLPAHTYTTTAYFEHCAIVAGTAMC